MTRVHDLIKHLAPNGVEFKTLGELCKVFNGYAFKSDLFNSEGEGVAVVRIRDVNSGFTNTYYSGDFDPKWLVQNGDILIGMDGDFRANRWKHGRALLNQRVCRLQDFDNSIVPGYLFYQVQGELDRIHESIPGSTVKHLSSRDLERSRIPVPPLEAQAEIVRILDQFTDLEAELEAELEARRRQFLYYRGLLLGFSSESWGESSIGDLFELRAGKFIPTSEIALDRDANHRIPCFGGGGLRGYVSHANQNGEHVLIGRQGALSGNVKRANGEFYATEHAVVVTPRVEADMRWAFHLLAEMNLNQYASKSAQPGLAVSTLNELRVLVPTIDRQREIGAHLDTFDALVSDITVSLAAELAARRKQYQYYRDSLLTFKEPD